MNGQSMSNHYHGLSEQQRHPNGTTGNLLDKLRGKLESKVILLVGKEEDSV